MKIRLYLPQNAFPRLRKIEDIMGFRILMLILKKTI